MDEIRVNPPDDRPADPPPVAPGERIERHETIESIPADAPPRRKESMSMAVWLIPLALVVLVLMWYVMQAGSPDSPLPEGGIEMEVPDIEAPAVISTPADEP